jgi:hypothetical protein
MIFSEKPGDVNALLAQAAAVVSGGASAIAPKLIDGTGPANKG